MLELCQNICTPQANSLKLVSPKALQACTFSTLHRTAFCRVSWTRMEAWLRDTDNLLTFIQLQVHSATFLKDCRDEGWTVSICCRFCWWEGAGSLGLALSVRKEASDRTSGPVLCWTLSLLRAQRLLQIFAIFTFWSHWASSNIVTC